MKHQEITNTVTTSARSGCPSQSWERKSRPVAEPSPKFGSSSDLNAIATAAEENSSGRK